LLAVECPETEMLERNYLKLKQIADNQIKSAIPGKEIRN
jgi:hypothetical protein